MESYDGGDGRYRGRDSLLRVTDTDQRGPLYDALIAGAETIGLPYNSDYNGAQQEGVAMTQTTISDEAADEHGAGLLEPARNRANLKVETGAMTEKLLFEGKRCVGVRYSVGGTVHEARVTREVMLSAGSINSPQLLELSGIGNPEVLRRAGSMFYMICPVSVKISATITIRPECAIRSRRRIGLMRFMGAGCSWSDRS